MEADRRHGIHRVGQRLLAVASDGGIFSFGDAQFPEVPRRAALPSPVTAMAATPTGNGYWLVGADGGMFTYGDAPYNGSAFGHLDGWPVVGIDVQRVGVPYQPGTTGYDISWPQCGDLRCRPHRTR